MRFHYGNLCCVVVAGLSLLSCMAPGAPRYTSDGRLYIKVQNPTGPPPHIPVAADIGQAPPGIPPDELPYWIKVKNIGGYCWIMNPLQFSEPLSGSAQGKYVHIAAPYVNDFNATCDSQHIIGGHVVLTFWNSENPWANGAQVGTLSGDTENGRFEGLVRVGFPLMDPVVGTAENGRIVGPMHPR